MLNLINEIRQKLQRDNPLVLNLTNYVTMDFVANGLLSIGASPLMSMANEEIAELLRLSNSVVINLGTLSKEFISLCEQVCHFANELNVPITLDPVGAGASLLRTNTAQKLIQNYSIAILRGNASEIMALSTHQITTKGVDSSMGSVQALDCAKILSQRHSMVVVISGKVDYIVEADRIAESLHGSLFMPMITGSGCLLTAVISAFNAVYPNPFTAAHAATVFYGMCGEKAGSQCQGPGSFKLHFLDALQGYPYYEN